MTGIVIHRDMFQAAVIPERHGALRPPKPITKLGLNSVREQIVQQWRAFFFRHVLEPARVSNVDVERLFAGFRMSSYYWVYMFRFLPCIVFAILNGPTCVQSSGGAGDARIVVYSMQRSE